MKGVVNGYKIKRFSSRSRNGIFIYYLKDGAFLHLQNIIMLMEIQY